MDHELAINTLLKFYPTWDNYSLSIMFIGIFSKIFPKGSKNKFILRFTQLLASNMEPNPSTRLSITDSLEKFRMLFYVDGSIFNYEDMLQDMV